MNLAGREVPCHRKPITLVDCNISAKAFTISKPSRDKDKQKFEEEYLCKP
ncbi:MAG TPA: hypothetical protein VEH06_01285 [Candidatus Bathyarchaeia archaeon]|nr:hypothetical protein [Candidatus Bathyarchaeia archaeon]